MAAGSSPQRRRRPAPVGAALRQLGAQIRRERLKAGLSLAELGRPYVTASGVSRIEHGLSAPSYKVLIHFGRRLGVSVRLLIPVGH